MASIFLGEGIVAEERAWGARYEITHK